jgi:transcription termination/antitermination protein NusG
MHYLNTLPTEGDWYVLHTRSRQEKALAKDLERFQFNYFLPLFSHLRLYGKRKAMVEEPLFPGYVFLRGTLDNAYVADRTKRIASILSVPNQVGLDWELRNLAMVLNQRVPMDPYPYLKEGVRVEVRTGPLRGLQGFVERRMNSHRLVIQVDILGQAVSVELHGAEVDKL